MQVLLELDTWEREIAVAEADLIRETVRDAICSGRGSFAALQEVDRRMSSLTEVQRDMVVEALELLEDRAER
jgi:hypothetical protein